MPTLLRHIVQSAVMALIALPTASLQAGEQASPVVGAGYDNAINSVLAAGMYGFAPAPGLSVQLQHSDTLWQGLSPEKSQLSGQAITFSYEGSSGLLEFSAGYILSTQGSEQEPGAVFLGVDPGMNKVFDPSRSWYLAFDLSRSYQVDDNISFTLGNKAMLLKNPFDTEEGQIFSMLFNMPISYKNYLTITPAFQWSRSLSGFGAETGSAASGAASEKSAQDVFYGGVSVSFSY